MFKKEKGFTIIELLVVVAIISVLAAIVLVNVTQYINRGKDASIKGNMATILTNMAIFYDENGDFDAFNADTTYTTPETAIENAKPQTVVFGISDDNTRACVCAEVYDTTNGTYCVDYRGYKNQTSTDCATRCTSGSDAGDGQCTD